jgi:hypothetical protein
MGVCSTLAIPPAPFVQNFHARLNAKKISCMHDPVARGDLREMDNAKLIRCTVE